MNIHIVFGKNVNFKRHMVKMKFPSEKFHDERTKYEWICSNKFKVGSQLKPQNLGRYVPKLCKKESKISKFSLDKYINTYFPNQTELEIYRSRALFALKSRTAK